MKLPNLFTYDMKEDLEMDMQQFKAIRTVELFAGVGGFRIGLEKI